MSLDTTRDELESAGWAVVATGAANHESISAQLLKVARSLGEVLPGRRGIYVEDVVPETSESARVGSLSRLHGLSPLPLHNDTAHWVIPCRYLALACVRPGPTPTPTFLQDIRKAALSDSERLACRSEVFAIRNGRASFYGTIEAHSRQFVRVDPGCMTPLTEQGALALAAFNIGRHSNVLERHDWRAGEILVLDNWRFLHARGYDEVTQRGRLLLRAMVR